MQRMRMKTVFSSRTIFLATHVCIKHAFNFWSKHVGVHGANESINNEKSRFSLCLLGNLGRNLVEKDL